MKQEIVNLLRAARVLPIAERLNYVSIFLREHRSNSAFARSCPDEAFPPCKILYDAMSSTSYPDYFSTGRQIAGLIHAMAEPYLPQQEAVVCEWGCGPGRIIRHMRQIDPARKLHLFASDYNGGSIDWCAKHLQGVDFRINGLAPPLPFGAELFDWLYCISVFTHLSEAMHRVWIAELLRAVKTGGILLLTTHGNNFRSKLLPFERSQYDDGGLVERGNVAEGSRTYIAFESPAYMRRLLQGQEILLHQPNPNPVLAGGQDVWIVRKTGKEH